MAEKFRPRQISDVIGQDTVKNLVRRSLRNKTFPQFSLMYGPSGSGKSTMAEISALSLTCENQENGEPCCECKSCKDNLRQLNAGKASMNLVKINMGAIERSDFKQTIKEVFTLQPALGDNAVYIFEEIQALTKDDQNILLEYLSNIQNNIYVIACTTEMQKLRAELKNRAIKFAFKSLKTEEALALLDKVCKEKGITKPPVDMAKFLVRSANNCPREIVMMIDFLADAESLTEKDISEFLGFISNSKYIEFFEKCSTDTYNFVQWLDELQELGFINMVKGLRNFAIDCYSYIYGSNTSFFNTQEKHRIKEVFMNVDEERMLDVMNYFDTCKYDDETSAKYCLINGRRKFNNQTVKTIVKETKHDASKAVIQSENKTRNNVKVEKKVEAITFDNLDDLLVGMNKVQR